MKPIRWGLACAFVALIFLSPPLILGQTAFTVRNAKPGGSFLWGLAASLASIVAVGEGGTILTSPRNGSAWSRVSSGVTDWLVGVTYALNKFVTVGDGGRILVSTDGATWTAVTNTATTRRLNNVIYAGGQFVAVGEAGTIITSPDAVTWTSRVSGVTGWLRGIGYQSFSFPTRDGETQGSIDISGKQNYILVTFPFGKSATGYEYVACGQGGTVLRSPDGITWSAATNFGSNDLETLVAVNSKVDVSTFGTQWGYASFVTIGQSGFVGNFGRVSGYGAHAFSSMASIAARSYTTGSPARMRGLAQGVDALFATGEGGMILSAPNVAGPWTVVSSGTSANLVNGLYVGDTLFVVGENETILQSTPLYNSRLVNISSRSRVGTGGDIMISGIVVTGSSPKKMLLRAAGPALTAFGVAGTLSAPVISVVDSLGRPLATNTKWSTASNAAAIAAITPRVGAFGFTEGSADSALLLNLDPGSYTVQVAGSGGGTGVSLVEAYDTDGIATETSRAINISTRGLAGAGADALIAGFSIAGAASRRVLIRGVGPALGAFGVGGVLAKPTLELYDSTGALRRTVNVAWSQQGNAEEIKGAAEQAGAFALNEGSDDVALVTILAPGNWTVKIVGTGNATGVAMVEVYDLP